ncbi:hypothetical protein Tco_0819454 [Tanacetum coccineum]|uniref:Uncharacterized protein n=1 Tax=Tanacetum coccineum TaxID=301880 RepID=A0ABQ5A6M2_9ASTR
MSVGLSCHSSSLQCSKHLGCMHSPNWRSPPKYRGIVPLALKMQYLLEALPCHLVRPDRVRTSRSYPSYSGSASRMGSLGVGDDGSSGDGILGRGDDKGDNRDGGGDEGYPQSTPPPPWDPPKLWLVSSSAGGACFGERGACSGDYEAASDASDSYPYTSTKEMPNDGPLASESEV